MAQNPQSTSSTLTLAPDEVEVEAPPTPKSEPKTNGAGKKRKAATTSRPAKRAKKAEPAPLEQRTESSNLCVGAHVSSAGGVQNAITNLIHIGANAFALFLKSQRKWENPPLDSTHVTAFLDACKAHSIDQGSCCVPHGSYLVNLGDPREEAKEKAVKTYVDDLTRCAKLGISLYNIHPGNSKHSTREEAIQLIAQRINDAHADPETGNVVTLLETMATAGNTVGGTFEDIADLIAAVTDKSRIGVCLDTCHVFAAGYDLRTPDAFTATMTKFDEVIGLKYLKALHVNDSKAPFDSHKDLHARIGTGYLGLRAFHNLVNDKRLHGLPMVLETPIDGKDENGKKIEDKSVWAREIKMLERLVGMDIESEEFLELEKKLQKEGEGERGRVGGQVQRKNAKLEGKEKVKGKGRGKGKGRKKDESEEEGSEVSDDE